MPSQGYVNVNVPNAQLTGVSGPYSGSDLVGMLTTGIHIYPTEAAAQAAQPQSLNGPQTIAFEHAILSGPGIGQGFFGLGHDITHAPGQALSDLWHGLDLGQILLYVGEFVLGVVLVGVGLAKLTGTDNVINKAAKAAGAAAIL